MNKKESIGHFVPSSGFLNDGIKKWKPKEPIEDYVLSADGYCLNPKKLIEEFLGDMKDVKRGIECKHGWNSVGYYIRKWEKKLEEMEP